MATLLVLYLIFGSGMIWGYTKSKKDPRKAVPKLMSIICAVAIVMVAILSPLINAGPDRVAIEDQYRNSRLQKLAADLATKVTGPGKVLVIHSYDVNNERSNQHLQRSLAYLQEGFAGKANVHKLINPAPPSKNQDEIFTVFEVMIETLVCDCWEEEKSDDYPTISTWLEGVQTFYIDSDKRDIKSKIDDLAGHEILLEITTKDNSILQTLIILK